jgi:PKD repeat protein
VTRGFITSVVTVGSLALVFAAEATAAPTDDTQAPAQNRDHATQEILAKEPPTVPPVVAIEPPGPLFALEPVTFTSTTTPGTGDIVNTEWDFGDGGVGTGPTATHTFQSAGTYTVRLLVEDSEGLEGEAVLDVVVDATRSPAAGLSVSPSTPTAGLAATFTSNSLPINGFPITSTGWYVDGTFVGNGQSLPYRFQSPGPHSVRVVVVDSRGLSSQAETPVTVNARPVAEFTAFPASPLVGEEVNLTSDSSDDGPLPAQAQAWDLNGDGVFGGVGDATGSRAKVMFVEPGNHTVALRVTDGHGATSTVSKVISARRASLLQPIGNQGNSAPSTGRARPVLKLISPFPLVRLTGAVVKRGTRIRRLSVRAPAGSRVIVYCRGRGCPVRRVIKFVKRSTVRFAAFERVLRSGTLLEVLVRRGDQMGKYTSFRLRRTRVPKRIDGCLPPSASRGVTCQAD